jgi:hypothetical protein
MFFSLYRFYLFILHVKIYFETVLIKYIFKIYFIKITTKRFFLKKKVFLKVRIAKPIII